MQFDYPIILALMSLSTLVVIILLKFIYRDNPHYNEEYGDEIVLFHSQKVIKEEFGDSILLKD